MKVTVISSKIEFKTLEYEWKGLLKHSTSSTFFLCFDWLNIWWQRYSSCSDILYIITIRNNNKLIAIAPFYLGDNILRFIGTNEEYLDEVCTEYSDIIYLKESEDTVINLIINELNKRLSLGNELKFSNYLEKSLLDKIIRKCQLSHWSSQNNAGTRYFCDLPEDFDTYLTSLKPSFSKKMKRLSRKCINQLDGHIDKTESQKNISTNFKVLETLHTSHWNSKEKNGAFTSSRFTDFHLDFCIKTHQEHKLQLWILSIKKEPISAIYCIDYEETRFFYQAGINTNLKPNISPGNLLHLFAIEDAIKLGLKKYDFMKGDKTGSYKQIFTNNTSNMYNVHIIKKSLKNSPKKVIWWLKKIRDKIN